MAAKSSPVDLAHEDDFVIGPLTVRPSLRTIIVDGRNELLEPRIMQVFVALARCAGEVVSRDDLVARCWAGRVVGEDAISRPVIRLRKLGEETQAFSIETIPRVGYCLRAKVDRSASAPLPSRPVLAVLAFDDLSGDPDLAYFSDGISDEILQAVSRGVKTIGRSSSFQFRGPDKAVRKVVGELGATHVLDGSIRRGGDMVRINAQLIEGVSQTTIWQGQFDRPMRDLFAVQDEIAIAVATSLRQKLIHASPPGEIDPETHQLFLRLREGAFNMTMPAQMRIDLAAEITRRAPLFGPGWVEAARVRAVARRNLALSREDSERHYDEMQAAFDRARQLLGVDDPLLTAAEVNWQPWAGSWTACETRLRRVLQTSPHSAALTMTLAQLLAHAGRLSDMLDTMRDIYEREPLNAGHTVVYAIRLDALQRHEEAFAISEGACRRWPGALYPWHALVTNAAREGRWDIVDRWTTPAILSRHSQNRDQFESCMAEVDMHRSPTEEKRNALLRDLAAEIEGSGRFRLSQISYVAQFCDPGAVHDLVARGSLAHLFDPRQGYDSSDHGAQALFSSRGKGLRTDPRFVTLCARLGLVDHWTETGRWPDCAQTAQYDFRAEARRAAGTPPG